MFEKILEKKPVIEKYQINKSFLKGNNKIPLVIQPSTNNEYFEVSCLKEKKEEIIQNLLLYGAILFRGYNIDSTEKLRNFSLCFVDELLPYVEKRSPRTTLEKNVYSSTIHPADQYIHFHNTTSFSHQWPMKIWFCCFHPAEEQGYTPISDCRQVLLSLSNATRKKFEKYGVMYVKNFQKDVGLSWEHSFDTTNKSEVEAYCKQHDIEFEWLPDNGLRTKQVRHAIARHPTTGDMVWFNQAHHFHVLSLEKSVSEALLKSYREEDLPRHSYFGNGDPITQEIIDEITDCYAQHESIFPWEKGDVLMLDNMLTAHSRTPYKGDRLIALTLGEMYEPKNRVGGII